MTVSLALYQPDIPQNTATLLRTGACLDVEVHIIKPAGFVLSDKNFRRAGMDYLEKTNMRLHESFELFQAYCRTNGKRIVLLSTKSSKPFSNFKFSTQDILLLGRESSGVPQNVAEQTESILRIPMNADARSLNIAISAAIVLSEALRQTAGFTRETLS